MYFTAVLVASCSVQERQACKKDDGIYGFTTEFEFELYLNEHAEMTFIVIVKFPYSPAWQYFPFHKCLGKVPSRFYLPFKQL